MTIAQAKNIFNLIAKIQFCLLVGVISTNALAIEKTNIIPETKKRLPKYRYEFIERDHTVNETLRHIGIMYGASWAVYPASQFDVFKNKGSFENYRRNFGQIVFDKDEPFWNWMVHPISGSQLFLYYRANGYNRINSLALAFVSSTLFEFTVEIYTEPASVQDLYQTPILGSVLGVGLENLSLYLLNTGNAFGKVLAHIINPWTMFDFFDQNRIMIIPKTNYRDRGSLNLIVRF
jgi:hypothetical protein